MTTDSNHEAFEKWYQSSGLEWTGYGVSDPDDLYKGWQAATTHNKEKLREVRNVLQACHNSVHADHKQKAACTKAIATLDEMIGGE